MPPAKETQLLRCKVLTWNNWLMKRSNNISKFYYLLNNLFNNIPIRFVLFFSSVLVLAFLLTSVEVNAASENNFDKWEDGPMWPGCSNVLLSKLQSQNPDDLLPILPPVTTEANSSSQDSSQDSVSSQQSKRNVTSLQELAFDVINETSHVNSSSPDDNTQISREPIPGLQIYENSTLGFSIQHPVGSTITTKNDIVAFTLPKQVSDGNSSAYLLVHISDLSTPGMSLENYSNVLMDTLNKSRIEFKVEHQDNSSKLSGNPAHIALYTEVQGEKERKTLQLLSVANNQAYELTYVTDIADFDVYLPVIERMIDSFRIIGQYGSGVIIPNGNVINDTGLTIAR